MSRLATLYDILLVKSSATKQIKTRYLNMSLLSHLDDFGDEEFFKTINRAFQILSKDAAREKNNICGLGERENSERRNLNLKL